MHIPIVCPPAILDKIQNRHQVELHEVEQCFFNSTSVYLEDDREDHKTDPATLWFVAETDKGRSLKVVFVERDGNIFLKSAYSANEKTLRIYEELCNQERK